MNKRGSPVINNLIVIILIFLVILVVFMFIYKIDILEYLRNLPDYGYEGDKEIDASKLTDAQVKDMCPKKIRIGFIGEFEGSIGFREQYIYLIIGDKGIATKFYWKGNERDAKIWLRQEDNIFKADWFESDLEVAEVKDGVIEVKPGFLDLDSEINQRARFSKPIELRYVNKLDGSYTAFNNKICRTAEETEFKPAWPESAGIEAIALDLGRVVTGNKIDFSPYIEEGGFEYFYLKSHADFIEIRGAIDWWPDRKGLGRIYSDGSVWIDEGELARGISGWIRGGKLGASIVYKDLQKRRSQYYHVYDLTFYETNLRLNYQELKNKIK